MSGGSVSLPFQLKYMLSTTNKCENSKTYNTQGKAVK